MMARAPRVRGAAYGRGAASARGACATAGAAKMGAVRTKAGAAA
jgi:hypothetical protein